MPKQAKPRRAGELARWRRPGLHAVGNPPGLCLQITDTGARSWVLRISIGGRQRGRALRG